MKYTFVVTLLLSGYLSAARQSDFYALSQRIPAAPYLGKTIRLEGAIRWEDQDPSAKAGLWMRVDNKNNSIGYFKNNWKDIAVTSQWQTFRIEAPVNDSAARIMVGGLFAGKGRFYMDNFKLSVLSQGQWEPVPLPNPSFEDSTAIPNWFLSYNNSQRVALTYSRELPAAGSLAFCYQVKEASDAYGANPQAGQLALINGIQLYYEIYGKGEPLLLLHGNSQNIAEYKKQIDFFRKKYKVIAVDTRGHGQSGTDTTRYTYQLFASDMNALLAHLKLKKVNVLGWSDGGNTGLVMAMQYPKKVKRLAIMGANIFINEESVLPMVLPEIEKQIAYFQKDSSARAANSVRLMRLLREEPNLRFTDLEAIRIPVLVMAGENDLIQEKHTRGIARHIKGSELVIFPKGTHNMPQENAPEFNRTVDEFLQQR